MSDSKKFDATPPDARAVLAAEAKIEQRAAAQREEKERRIADALNRLRYGDASGAGYQWSGGLLYR